MSVDAATVETPTTPPTPLETAPTLTLEDIVAAVFDPAWQDYLPQAVKALEPYRTQLEGAATDACNLIEDHIKIRQQSLDDDKATLLAAVPATVWNELHDNEPDVHRVLIAVADGIKQTSVVQRH